MCYCLAFKHLLKSTCWRTAHEAANQAFNRQLRSYSRSSLFVHLGMINPLFITQSMSLEGQKWEDSLKNLKFLCMKQTELRYQQVLKSWILKVRKTCLYRISVKVRNVYRVQIQDRYLHSWQYFLNLKKSGIFKNFSMTNHWKRLDEILKTIF